jgi:hypothetical protein
LFVYLPLRKVVEGYRDLGSWTIGLRKTGLAQPASRTCTHQRCCGASEAQPEVEVEVVVDSVSWIGLPLVDN